METTFGLVANSARTATNHHSDGLGELAVLNQDNLVTSCAKDHLLDLARLSELFGGDLFEARDDACASSNGEEFDLDSANPANGREFVLHEQVVGLVVETPLAENAVCARVFDALDHINEVVLLHLLQLFVVSGRLDFKTVLRFRLWGLEGTGQNADLGVLNAGGHLRVGKLLVNDDALNELRVFDAATSFGHNLDQIEVHVTTLQISDVEY